MAGAITGYKTYPVYFERWGMHVTIVRTEQGVFYFTVRHICKGLGVSVQSQLELLHTEAVYTEALETFKIPTDGGIQEAVCIRKRECAWWLGHISPKRVREAVRGQVEDLQRDLMEAADRLAFGDLSGVLHGGTVQRYQPVQGAFHFGCLRCGAPHRFVVRDGAAYVEIDDTDEGE